jgi:hypothetical protein
MGVALQVARVPKTLQLARSALSASTAATTMKQQKSSPVKKPPVRTLVQVLCGAGGGRIRALASGALIKRAVQVCGSGLQLGKKLWSSGRQVFMLRGVKRQIKHTASAAVQLGMGSVVGGVGLRIVRICEPSAHVHALEPLMYTHHQQARKERSGLNTPHQLVATNNEAASSLTGASTQRHFETWRGQVLSRQPGPHVQRINGWQPGSLCAMVSWVLASQIGQCGVPVQ